MKNIELISNSCNLYPQKLLNISNFPDILFAIGNTSLLNTFSLAVIGSRNYTLDAKIITQNLVKDLVSLNITIVSGMARGIDTIAHEACIDAGGKTIAILGAGFLIMEKQKIFKKILDNDGLILSEYLPDMPAYKSNFPRRNELIAGISSGVIITQAAQNSGSLITAHHAIKQQKPIFTFPYNIDNECYRGNNILLTKSAKCILSYKDIMNFYPEFKKTKKGNKTKIEIKNEFKEIYSNLKDTPVELNRLAHKLNMDISMLQYKLTLMEIEGLIVKLPNNYFSRKAN